MLFRSAQRFALLAGGRAWIKLREQDSVRAWKMPENGAESRPSSARIVGRILPSATLLILHAAMVHTNNANQVDWLDNDKEFYYPFSNTHLALFPPHPLKAACISSYP